MLRAEKAQEIDDLNAAFKSAGVLIVTHYKGLSVAEVTDLRSRMRAAGAGFRVAKNRLAKIALEGTPFESVRDILKGPTAFAYSVDPTAAPKVAIEYARKNDKLVVVGGGVGGSLLDAASVKALSELPSLDELRGRLIGLLAAPASRLVGVLQAPAGQVARVFSAYADKG
ncbi:MAG: 50S ribosomal protein L10 [Geminicoccaceae bacterium]